MSKLERDINEPFEDSKFADDDGNLFNVKTIYDFVESNPQKYLHKNFPLNKIKHNLEWWDVSYDIDNPNDKERVLRADLSYPLLVIKEKDGNLSVSDGLNRLYKAINLKHLTHLPVFLVKKNEIEHLALNKEDKIMKNIQETENLKGGLADGKTIESVAKKHKIDVDLLKIQLQNGIKVEKEEHTDNEKTAKEIALDHLWENPRYYIKLKKADVDEITGASSDGAFSGVPAFGNAPTKLRKINNMEGKKIEATEATDASSSGAFSDVPFGGKNTKGGGRKNPLKIDGPDSIYKNRAVTDPKWPKFGGPGGYYVKPKKKCEKFPYCNQGNTGALEFIHENYSDLKVAITETANKLGVPYNTVQKIVLNEIKQIFI